MDINNKIIQLLKEAQVDFFTTLPCAKIQRLMDLVHTHFNTIGLTKEEEGVGICAGASLAGANPAMLIQSTGLGNMINALCSLTLTYQLPLFVLASWRGVYQETIPAQIPLGERLPKILEAIGCKPEIISHPTEIHRIGAVAKAVYEESELRVVLLSPQLWERLSPIVQKLAPEPSTCQPSSREEPVETYKAEWIRSDVLQTLAPFLDKKLVVCNMGFPSRELFQIKHQPSNFYMLGSLGLASAIGLGVAHMQSQPVAVIDGDGSLLSNLGVLATIAQANLENLTIFAIDNQAHGSTGNQLTATSHCADLAATAHGLGIEKIFRVSNKKSLERILNTLGAGPNFIHILAKAGNIQVPPIPLTPLEIKHSFMAEVAGQPKD